MGAQGSRKKICAEPLVDAATHVCAYSVEAFACSVSI